MKILFREMNEEKFNIKEWPSEMAKEEIIAKAVDTSDQTLKECLVIVDAKSLYDYLAKETIGGSDKRTAIEIQIIREEMELLNGNLRWVDHPAMATKVKGSTKDLFDLLSSGTFGIVFS